MMRSPSGCNGDRGESGLPLLRPRSSSGGCAQLHLGPVNSSSLAGSKHPSRPSSHPASPVLGGRSGTCPPVGCGSSPLGARATLAAATPTVMPTACVADEWTTRSPNGVHPSAEKRDLAVDATRSAPILQSPPIAVLVPPSNCVTPVAPIHLPRPAAKTPVSVTPLGTADLSGFVKRSAQAPDWRKRFVLKALGGGNSGIPTPPPAGAAAPATLC